MYSFVFWGEIHKWFMFLFKVLGLLVQSQSDKYSVF